MNFAQFIRSTTFDTIHRSDRIDNMKQFRILEPKLSKSHRARNEDIDPPIERSGHRMLCDDDYVYVVGGYCPYYSEQLIQEIWRFNILTEEWELMDAEGDHFPPEMASFALCAEGSDAWKRAFLFGGTMVPFGDESSNRVTMLKKLRDAKFTWQPLPLVGEEPIQQYGSAILMHNGVLYQVGGTTGHIYNMEVRSLTPVRTETNKPCASNFPEPHLWRWTLLNKAENEWGRYRHEVELVGDEIIIVGGGNPHWASTLDTLLVFDICS
uniref:Kelch repeat protein n=1 Tax=Parascaris univalens TaxID=6257 RepID=A0A915CK45_PARUN